MTSKILLILSYLIMSVFTDDKKVFEAEKIQNYLLITDETYREKIIELFTDEKAKPILLTCVVGECTLGKCV